MPLDKSGLLGLLEAVDDELTRKITLVAAGDTAMTLLDLKPSTIDIDFTGPREDTAEFNKVQRSIPHGFEVQTWTNGMVFSQQLPDDYLKNSIQIKTKPRCIHRCLEYSSPRSRPNSVVTCNRPIEGYDITV